MTDILTRIIACDGNPQETAELILEAWLADNPEAHPRGNSGLSREHTYGKLLPMMNRAAHGGGGCLGGCDEQR